MSESVADDAGFEISLQQERLWAAEPTGPTARSQAVVALPAGASIGGIRAALGRVVARHEALRTTFARPAGLRLPLQVVADAAAPAWAEVAGTVSDAVDAAAAEPVDLGRGPVLRARLVHTNDDDRLLLTAPAVVADSESLVIAGTELLAVLIGGDLGDEPVQYADYAAWQREQLPAAATTAAVPAADPAADEVGLPFAARLTAAAAVRRPIAADARPAVDALAERLGVPAADAWLALWLLLAGRLAGSTAASAAVAVDLRPAADLPGAVGPYAGAVPVAVTLDLDASLGELVARVAAARADAERRLDPAQLVATAHAYGFVRRPSAAGVRAVATAPVADQVQLEVGDDTVEVVAGSAADAERVVAALERLLSTIESADARLRALDVLPAAERQRLVVELNQTAAAVPDVAGVHLLVEEQADRTPDAPAVRDGATTLSYAELDARANQVGHLLRSLGVTADVPVALCLDRTPDLVVALLGVLKAGGAYLPLHPEHPRARLALQLTRTGAPVVLTQRSLLDALPETSAEVICLDTDRDRLDPQPTDRLDPVTGPDSVAYVIYTSGSTGEPKGVAVRHGSVVNYATAIVRAFGFDAEPLTFGLVTTVSTDLGNTSTFGALTSGGCLELVPVDVAADPDAYAAYAAARPVDVLKITPSHLEALLPGGGAVLPRRRLVLGGEPLEWRLVDAVRAARGCAITNHYGPTETTVGSLVFDLGSADAGQPRWPGSVPLGRPIANTTAYVVDAAGRPAPVGVPGELLIGGAGLARGYWGDPGETAARFGTGPDGAGRCYRTGDVVRFTPDGTVQFLRRVDDQAKVRGFRVEPGEVEAALRAAPEVQRAAVVVTADGGEPRLVGYVVGEVRTRADVERLRTGLAERLPPYLLPAAIVPLDELPLTPSGKLDRRRLPAPQDVRLADEPASVPPRTETERRIAEIWAEVLRVESVSVVDDFFALGGHSLLATQVIARIRSAFGVQLPLPSLFLAPTVEGLALLVGERLAPAPADDDLARMLAELEDLTDEEAERLLRLETEGGS